MSNWPNSLSRAPWRPRSRTRTPSSLSSSAMPADIAGCDMRCAAAARVNEPCSAMARRMRRCRGSISINLDYAVAIFYYLTNWMPDGQLSAEKGPSGPCNGEDIERMPGRSIYLVGSVPLASTAEVFERVSAAFGRRIAPIPDGEVGERSDWVAH